MNTTTGIIASQATEATSKAKVFISYSRKDRDFVDRLEASLKAGGFEVLIDREEILAFEEWWKRLQALIVRADTVVFVLSPDAVGSQETRREVDYAATLNKRFAPIVCRAVEDRAVPEALRGLNYIFFDDPVRFDYSLNQLATALRTDIGWVRKQTDLGEAALHWSMAGRPRGLLLRSPDLEQAEHWIASRPQSATEPTVETKVFIAESRRDASRRRNVLIGALASGLAVSTTLAIFALAQKRHVVVEDMNRRAALAQQLATGGQTKLAAAVALDAMASGSKIEPATEQVKASVHRTLGLVRKPSEFNLGENVFNLSVSPDGRVLAAGTTKGMVYVFDPSTLALRFKFQVGNDVVSGLDFSPDSKRLVASGDKIPNVWDVETGKKIFDLKRPDVRKFTFRAEFSPDGKLIVVGTAENRALIYDAKTGALLRTLPGATLEEMRGRLRDQGKASFGVADPIVNAVANVTFTIFGAATDAVFSPDSKIIAVTGPANPDGSVRLFDATSGKLLRTLTGGRGTMFLPAQNYGNTLAFVSGGAGVIATPIGKTLKVWDVRNGNLRAEFPIRGISSFLATTDGLAVVSAQENGSLLFRCLARDSEIISIQAHTASIGALSADSSGSLVATGSDDRTARVWRMPQGSDLCGEEVSNDVKFDSLAVLRPIAILTGHKARVAKVAFSENNRSLTTASQDGWVRTYPVHDQDAIEMVRPSVNSFIISGDGRAAFLHDDNWHGYDVSTGREIEIPDGIAAIAPGDRNHGAVLFRSPDTYFSLGESAPKKDDDGSVSFGFDSWNGPVSPDGYRTVRLETQAGTKDTPAVLYDTNSKQVLARLVVNGRTAQDFLFSGDGSRLIARLPTPPNIKDSDNKSRAPDGMAAWDAQSGKLIAVVDTIEGYQEASLRTLSRRGDRLLIGANLLFEISEQGFKRVSLLDFAGDRDTHPATLSSDGAREVIGRNDGTIIVADTIHNQLALVLDTQALPIRHVAISTDGRYISAADSSDTVWIFDFEAGQPVRTKTFPGAIRSLAFLPNSDRLAVLNENSLTIVPVHSTFDGKSDALSIAASARTMGFGEIEDNDRRRFNLDPSTQGRGAGRK